MENSRLSKSPLDPQCLTAPPNEVEHNEWTYEENKLFVNALTEVLDSSPQLLEKIAIKVPGKTVEEIKGHYKAIVKDFEIVDEAGNKMPLPANHQAEVIKLSPKSKKKKGSTSSDGKKPSITSNSPRLWTDEEHKLFIMGYEKHGRSWTNISKHYVKSKTPTQVATHGRRYLKHQSRATNITNIIVEASSTSDSASNHPPLLPSYDVNVPNYLSKTQISGDQHQLPPPLGNTAAVKEQNHCSNNNQPKFPSKVEEDCLDWHKFPRMLD